MACCSPNPLLALVAGQAWHTLVCECSGTCVYHKRPPRRFLRRLRAVPAR